MTSANLSHVAGYSRSHTSQNKAAVRLSEAALIRIAAVLVGVTFFFTAAVLGFCDRQDDRLEAAGIAVEQILGEVR